MAIDYSRLPVFGLPAKEEEPQKGLFSAGLKSGVRDLQAIGGSALQGAGKLFGSADLEETGRSISQSGQEASAAAGRADLEIAPWKEGGADVLPWLGYQASKQVPMLAAYLLGGKAYRMAGGPVSDDLARLGTSMPRALGGGGLREGADFAQRRAARKAGAEWAGDVTGGAVAGVPIAFGSMVQEADEKEGGLTLKDARDAAMLSPVYSLLDATQPAQLKGLMARGQAGNMAKRIATAAFVGAAGEVPQEGLQTALEMSFRPDLSAGEKLTNIVDAAVTGGAVGGVFGGAAGIRAMKRADPNELTGDDIRASIDAVLGLPSPQQAAGTPPAPNEQVVVTGEGLAGKQPNPFDFQQSELDTPKAPRPYEATSTEELNAGLAAAQKAIASGNESPAIQSFIEAARNELQVRNDLASNEPAQEGSRGGDAQAPTTAGDGGKNSAAPAPVNPQTEVSDLLKGISTRKSYSDAKSREELETVLRARLEAGSSAKGDFTLAERLGIDLNAPAAAAPVETKAAPAADTAATEAALEPLPAEKTDAEFVAQFKADVQKLGQKDKGARALKPANEADAQRQIYQALGRDAEIGDGLEKLAQKYGILDAEKRLTPLAAEIAKREPIPREEAAKAAKAQGLKGADITKFVAGVEAATVGRQISPKIAGDAVNAGSSWAAERNAVPKGSLTKYDPSAYTGEVTDEQVAAMGRTAQPAQPRVVPEQAREQQVANRAIDATQAAFATPQDDVAALKKMVRDGDVDGAMMALQRVQAGQSLFEQPDAQPVDFRGEAPVRGAPRVQQDKYTVTATKGQSKAAAEVAIRKFELTRAIDNAFAEGAIDSKERLRLVGKLRSGQVEAVREAIPTSFTGEKLLRPTSLAERTARRNALREQFEELAAQAEQETEVSELSIDRNGVLRAAKFQGTVVPETAAEVQEQLEGKSALEVADFLIKTAPSQFHRQVAQKIKQGIATLQRAGFAFEFKIVRAGDLTAPAILSEARGLAYDNADTDVTTIWINGTDAAGPSGLTYEVIQHEMLHAVTMQSIEAVEFDGNYEGRLGKAVQDLQAVTDAIQAHFANRRQQGNLTNLERYILESNALADQHEVLAWALSSPEFQTYLDTIDYTPRQTLWGKFVEAMRVFLGLGARGDGALIEVLRVSEEIIGLGPVEFELAVAGRGSNAQMARVPGTVQAMQTGLQSTISSLTEKLPIESISNATRRTVFGWNSIGHLVTHYGAKFPALEKYAKAQFERRATQARWAQLFEGPYQAYEQLEAKDGKAATNIRYLMSLTQFQIDPTKTWEQHEHLQEEANKDRLKELVADANRKYQVLRGQGHAKIYDDFRSINEATHLAMMSVSLHNLVASDPVLRQGMTGFGTDPTDAFREQPGLHENAVNARRYWGDTLDAQVRRAEEYIAELRGATTGSASEQKIASMRLEPIEMRIRSIRESQIAMRNAPYFHLGRHGDHFVSFTLRLNDNKVVDQAAIDRAGQLINEAGFTNIEISRDQTRPNVYVRVETIEARKQLEKVVKQLQREGFIKPDSEIKAAPRNSAGDTGTADQAPAWLERYIELLQASPMFDPTENMSEAEKTLMASKKAQMVSHARELWLDMLPDTAIAKVMVHRNSVPGFDKDMVRNFAFRFQVGVNSLSNLSSSAKLTDAFTDMRALVFDAQVADSDNHEDVDLLQDLMAEVLVREAGRPLQETGDWIDKWRAINHAFFLGFSPSYVLVNTTQLGVLLWPELAKKHGFAKSAKAIGKVTGLAFNIMKETLAAGTKVSAKRALDAVITEDVLRKAGADPATQAFLTKIISDGIIDIGGSSRELGRVADGGVNEKLDTGLRWAASFGLYSETFSRLVAALAAREVAGDDLPYARQIVNESMLNYSTWNTARQMGKMALWGRWTPVMMSFLQYSAQVTEKLYREFHVAITKDADPAAKAEARRFLGGHLTAVTALAGTLGLPFVTVFATLTEKLVDILGDDEEPFDATAAYRNFVSDIFGKEIGEIVARGAPRAVGFDLSQRAGEQNLLPFSQFLADKRKWREAGSEQALRSMGAPVSMVLSILEGGEKIGDGDLMGGMAAMLPVSIKGPLQAIRMQEDGYIDTKGTKLPMTPGASASLVQLIGFTPAEKAEYSEARGDQAARESQLVRRAGVIRKQLVDAIIDGDDETKRDLIRKAITFDKANPAFAVLPDIEKSLDRRMKATGIARATGTPLGVNPKDRDGRDLTGYANIEFRP